MQNILTPTTLLITMMSVISLTKLHAQDIDIHVAKKLPCHKEKKSPLEADNIKGKVKKLVTMWYESIDTDVPPTKHLHESYIETYNDLGYLLERICGPGQGTHSRYTYDDHGNMLTAWHDFASNITNESASVYHYSSDGILSGRTGYLEQNGIKKVVSLSRYDKNGNDIYDESYDRRIHYTYDESGNCLEERDSSFYNGKFSSLELTTIAYDDHCRRARWEQIGYDPRTKVYSYDEKGREAEIKMHNRETGEDETETYKYDDHDNVIERKNVTGKNVSTAKYQYEYDDHGNWIKKDVYYSGKWEESYERVITYY